MRGDTQLAGDAKHIIVVAPDEPGDDDASATVLIQVSTDGDASQRGKHTW